MFRDPVEIVRAREYVGVDRLLDRLDGALSDGKHVAGFLAYEAGYAFEPTHFQSPTRPAEELGWFGIYDSPPVPVRPSLGGPAHLARADFELSPDAYAAKLAAVKARIREGDVYQINLTAPVTFETDADPVSLYGALRRRQPVGYGAFLRLPEASILSGSPELFFRIDRTSEGRTITTRPMKGTAPRRLGEDDALAEALVASEKDRAENLMIVDLLRNDLARVSEPGSVRVPTLFSAERYETVMQMTSTVQAQLRERATLGDVFRALFPCGSITGAPKLRAMRRILEIEDEPRGVYCGTIGMAAPDGSAAFSVAIRTAVLRDDGHGRYGVGSGIVWDSEAGAEYDECLLKARVLFDLVES